ncbi:fam-a protein, partial [Plasmodium chabaudi adami]
RRNSLPTNDAVRIPVLTNDARRNSLPTNDNLRIPVPNNSTRRNSLPTNDALRIYIPTNDDARKPVLTNDAIHKRAINNDEVRKPVSTNDGAHKRFINNDDFSMPVSSNNVIRKPVPINDVLRRLAIRNSYLRKVLLSESAPPKTQTTREKPTMPSSILKENSEKEDIQTCTNNEETKNAAELMNDAVTVLQKLVENLDESDIINKQYDIDLYCKNLGEDAEIAIFNFKISNPKHYDEIIKMIWNPNGTKRFNEYLINEKLVRLYKGNLVMMQQRHNSIVGPFNKYSYFVASKSEPSSDTTIIAFSSGNINDYNRFARKVITNPILESANKFKANVNSEEDIRDGKLKKIYINLSGYLIKKQESHIDMTFVYSINTTNYDISYAPSFVIKMERSEKLLMLSSLKEFFERK